MRILFVSSALHKEFGGPPMAVLGSAISLSRRGHDITVCIFGQSKVSISANLDFYEKLKHERIETRIAKSWKTRVHGGIGSISDVIHLFKNVKSADIISLHQVYNYQNIICAFFSFINKKPITLVPHGTLTKYQRSQHLRRKYLIDLIFFRYLLRLTKSIFVATQVEKDEINSSLKCKTEVVGLGVSFPETRKTITESRAPNEFFNFLYMGRIAPKKRLDIALEAYKYLPKEVRLGSKLVICGSGNNDYMKLIKNKAEELSIADEVYFKGWVSTDEKTIILNNSDCFLLTSEDENFAIAAGEALAYGIPCVLSKQVALSSLVEKHNAGIVFSDLQPSSISEAMLHMFNSDMNQMRKRALRASEELKWEFISTKWELAFKRVIGN